ncbi:MULTISPECIES: hypothetical protein [Clostridium]|nr:MULTISPECIES: hypothetical protein [unclassified Clostridium]
MRFLIKILKYEILSSSSKSKTATVFGNWITITFFKRNLQETIS